MFGWSGALCNIFHMTAGDMIHYKIFIFQMFGLIITYVVLLVQFHPGVNGNIVSCVLVNNTTGR